MKVVIDDYRLEKIDSYTEPLEAKIRRQAAEITRLLAENKELKQHNFALSVDVTGCKSMVESARAAGQEAWELARKILCADGYSMSELKEIFGTQSISKCISSNTYPEAAAKVAEWERKKEEICVGDVVECEGIYVVVVGVGECNIKGFTSDLTPFQWMKQDCTKTGRHIDVDAWMAQIGGDCNG